MFPGVIVEHFCVEFCDSICIGFWDILWKNRQADKHTNATENATHVNAVIIGNK